MLETIRKYLADEFECDVFDGSDTADDSTDRVLNFTFRRIRHTVVVTNAVLLLPPRDVLSFLTDRESALAEVVMMAEGHPVVVESTGFRIFETAVSHVL